jgi:uncharacterized membrane protein
VLYSFVPWIGVIAAGFGFGAVMALAPRRRNRICLALGLAAMALFLVLRAARRSGGSPCSAACRCSSTCSTFR